MEEFIEWTCNNCGCTFEVRKPKRPVPDDIITLCYPCYAEETEK